MVCVCIKKFPYNDIMFHVTLEILCAENDLHIWLQLSINFVNLIGIIVYKRSALHTWTTHDSRAQN